MRTATTQHKLLSRCGTLAICGGRATGTGNLARTPETTGTLITYVNFLRMTEADPGIVESMRARAAQCRRLAEAITDKRAAAVLLKMAEEVEADILRLETAVPNPIPPAAG